MDGLSLKNLYIILMLALIFSGCATKMAYVNTSRTTQEINADEDACNSAANDPEYKDESLRQRKIKECMEEKGYKAVSEKEAQNIMKFKELWVNPATDFKAYEAIFIEKVDVSQVKVKNMQISGTKVTDQDIDDLGEEMLGRFSKMLNALMPVVQDKEKIAGKKALCISLQLKDIAQTNVGFNAALQVASRASGLPLPVSSQGLFSFAGAITDFSSKEKLITISDESKSDKNASLAGLESFEKWKHAYNTMDYWADCLAGLLAAKRGQKYKSQLGLKLIDF